jgi:hypothetical protein
MPLIPLLALATALADDHATAPIAAMGGASVADPVDLTTIRTNPAAVGLSERYDVQGLFAYGADRSMRWGAAIADGRTNDHLSFGLSYMGGITFPGFLPAELPPYAITDEEPINKKQRHDIALAASVPVLDRRLAFGLVGNVTFFNQAWNGKGTTGNLGAGIAAHPIDQLTIGFSARDILPIKDQPDLPATLTLGARGGVDEIFIGTAEADFRLEDTGGSRWNARVGLQGAIQAARIRAGYVWQGDALRHVVTWGLGAASSAGSIDYAMQIPANLPGMKFGDVVHTISLTVKTGAFDEDRDPTDDTNGAPLQWKPNR